MNAGISCWKPISQRFKFNFHSSLLLFQILETRHCWKYNSESKLNWTLIYSNTENSCVFIFLQKMFPLGVYVWTISHIITDVLLVVGAFYKYTIDCSISVILQAALSAMSWCYLIFFSSNTLFCICFLDAWASL